MNSFIKKALRKSRYLVLNNPFTNWILVLLSIDHLPKELLHNNDWQNKKYNEDKTLEENVGYSRIPAIEKLVDLSKAKLTEFTREYLKPGDPVLDIGCGTGIFLKTLEPQGLSLYGIDLNAQFLAKAEALLPNAHLFLGNYLENFSAPKEFKLIYCCGVLMYIEPSNIKRFFDKLHSELSPGGYVFIQYSQAMKITDLLYPNITYVKYSPARLEKIVSPKFSIVRHEHFYDGRKVGWYDSKHYYFPDGTNSRLDTLENSYLLIIQKPV